MTGVQTCALPISASLRAAVGSSSAQRGSQALLQSLSYAAHDPGEDATGYLRPGTYIAVLDGNPFIENALGQAARAKRTQSTAVVYGILDSPANP